VAVLSSCVSGLFLTAAQNMSASGMIFFSLDYFKSAYHPSKFFNLAASL